MQLVFLHLRKPALGPLPAPLLLSTGGNCALTSMSLRLTGLRWATIGALGIHSFTIGFLSTNRL